MNNPDWHRRQSIRLRGYDYSRAGAYFITICTQNRECLFGGIVDGAMHLNAAGRMIARWYVELERKFSEIRCDAFTCMPNHTHFIIVNVGADLCVRPDCVGPQKKGGHIDPPLQGVVRWFKTMTTNEYIRGVKQNGWPPFSGKLWQRNYREHIVRNETELNRIREYIATNPTLWASDYLNRGADEAEKLTMVGEPVCDDPAERWMV